jgi:hypothetical protein
MILPVVSVGEGPQSREYSLKLPQHFEVNDATIVRKISGLV